MKIHTTIIAAVSLLTHANAQSITLNPIEDTDVYQFISRPTSSTHSLGVVSSNGAGHSQKSVIRFDLTKEATKIKAEEIVSAKLRLYVLPDSSPGSGFGGTLTPGTVAAYLQGSAWSTSTIRWTDFVSQSFIGSLSVTTASSDENPVWLEMDATSTVKSWLTGTANYGFLLQANDEMASPSLSVNFASAETGFKPQLVITTTGQTPIPTAKPELAVSSSLPKSTRKKTIEIRGISSGIRKVEYQVGDKPFKVAVGTSNWKFSAKLRKGKNRITIIVTDETGVRSESRKFFIKRL